MYKSSVVKISCDLILLAGLSRQESRSSQKVPELLLLLWGTVARKALLIYIVVQSRPLLPPLPAAWAACPCRWDLYAPLPRLQVSGIVKQRPTTKRHRACRKLLPAHLVQAAVMANVWMLSDFVQDPTTVR